MKNVEIFEANFTYDMVRKSNKIWIFGDNDLRIGNGGQAVIRDLNNSIGIRTKKSPSTSTNAYYTDDEYEDNCKKIFEDILFIKSKLTEGNRIVFSKNGYGTGLALLQQKAPKTFLFLCEHLKSFFEFDNQSGKKWMKIPSFTEIENGKYLKYIKQNEDILMPINNSLFLDHLLNSGYTNYFDAIKNGKKVSVTSKYFYKKEDILLLSFIGQKDYLVVKVISDSFDVSNLDIWSKLEGFKSDFLTTDLLDYKQTLFTYTCQLSDTGQIIFRDDFFSSEVPINKNVEDVENVEVIDGDILKEILLQLKDINKKLDNFNK